MKFTHKLRMLLPVIRQVDVMETATASATNSPVDVVILRKFAPTESGLGVLGQEVFECRYKWRRFLLLPAIFTSMHRELELMGHSVETAIAVKYDGYTIDAYELREAGSMVKGYPKLFGDMGALDVVRLMRARRDAARAWVDDHADEIALWRSRYGY